MDLGTVLSLAKRGRLRLLWRVAALFDPFYRVVFAASAASCGLSRLLAGGPVPFERLAAELAPRPSAHGALRAWLSIGVRLGELAEGPAGYRLKGALSRALSAPENDDVAALVEEVAGLHHRLIVETPPRLKAGEPWGPGEHDACLIARSSRILEPFVLAAMGRMLPASGPVALLDVGCGSGSHMCRAAEANPALRAVGVEARPEVAAAARDLARARGLADRVTVMARDVRALRGDGTFDVVTLHNVVYYFAAEERATLFERLSSFLKVGGRLLVTTCCQGGSPGMRVLDLWMRSAAGGGGLPSRAELAAQMREAGLAAVESRRLIAGEEYFAFTATRP